MTTYKAMPKNEVQANERANSLKKFLDKTIGGEWKIRVHENLGWFYSCSCGTIQVSEYPKEYGNGGISIMNGCYGVGFGGAGLKSFDVDTRDEISGAISKSLKEHKELIDLYSKHYIGNSKIKGYKNFKHEK